MEDLDGLEVVESGYADYEIEGVHYRIKRKFLPAAFAAYSVNQMVEILSKAGASVWWDNEAEMVEVE